MTDTRVNVCTNESEWLSSSIRHLIEDVCGLNSGSQRRSPSLLLVNFAPISIPNKIVRIPHKWQTDHIIKNVVDDFDGDELTALLSKQASDDGRFGALSSTREEPVAIVDEAKIDTARRDAGGVKKRDTHTHIEAVDNTSLTTAKAASTTRSQLSQLMARQDSKGKTNSDRRQEYIKLGNAFHNSAMERLQLSMNVPLQIKRVQELASGHIQLLEKEKAAVKNELKNYDSLFNQTFGFLPGHEEKEPLRTLYMYYRRLKVAIQKGTKGAQDPAGKSSSQTDEKLTADEMKLLKLQQDKVQLRAKLQKFQEEFIKAEGRPIRYHRDIVRIENEYKQYKQIKEHIKKLDETIKRKKTFQKLSSSHNATQDNLG